MIRCRHHSVIKGESTKNLFFQNLKKSSLLLLKKKRLLLPNLIYYVCVCVCVCQRAARQYTEAKAAEKEAAERAVERDGALSAAAAAADGEERARRELESVEATLAAETRAHGEQLASLQRLLQTERKGREEALVKIEESRAHVR